ncbi:MAG: hypothetical protein K6F51_09875 [Acetatifactor sp.]|nr:hypothetical protein [Acetatifactor sp.]
MNENRSKRREWVKTAAIVFLSILLVLTFFSQTILNHSLPEVATKFVQNGSITSKIRGSGTVESGDPYVVEADSKYIGRKVAGINFREGDKVQKGDVLLTLAEGDGTELEEAKSALKTDEASVDTAQKALKDAQSDYDETVLKDKISAQDIKNLATYRTQINDLRTSLQAAMDRQKPYNDAVAQLTKAIEDSMAQKTYEEQQNEYANTRVTIAETALPLAETARDDAAGAVTVAEGTVKDIETESETLEADYLLTPENYPDIEEKRADITSRLAAANKTLEEKKTALTKAEENLKKAQDELQASTDAKEARNASPLINNIDKAISDYTIQKHANQSQADTIQKEIDQIQGQIDELMNKNDNIAKLQGKQDAIDTAKKDLNAAKQSVADAKKKIEELSGENGGAEITADISGTITTINVTSGKKIDNKEIMVLQPEGMGFYFTLKVPNEQAKLVSVGDKATLVNSWYYSDMDITLKSIKPDKQDPAKTKVLTFSVAGDSVMVGQNLNISVGQRSQEYDCIIPKSALRNDINGDYVLIIESKSTPLGNRYIARRVDIQILAQDDNQAAVSGALNTWQDYVITTASGPIEAGSQVRITEN